MIIKTALPGVKTVKGFAGLINHIAAELNEFHKRAFSNPRTVKTPPIKQNVPANKSVGAFK